MATKTLGVMYSGVPTLNNRTEPFILPKASKEIHENEPATCWRRRKEIMRIKMTALAILPCFLAACIHTQGVIKVDPEPEERGGAPAFDPCYSAMLLSIPDELPQSEDHEVEDAEYKEYIDERIAYFKGRLEATRAFSEIKVSKTLSREEDEVRMAPWLVNKEDRVEITIKKERFAKWGPVEVFSVILYAFLAPAIVTIFTVPGRKAERVTLMVGAVRPDGEQRVFSASMTHRYWRNAIGSQRYYKSQAAKDETAGNWRDAMDEAWTSILDQMHDAGDFFSCPETAPSPSVD